MWLCKIHFTGYPTGKVHVGEISYKLSCGPVAEGFRRQALASSSGPPQNPTTWTTLLRLPTKLQVYRAVVVPTLLYGAETWVLYRKIRLLERVHQRCLRSILAITWQDHVSNEEVLKRTSLPSIGSILLQVLLATPQRWKTYACPKLSSSASSKKESAIVVLQESVTKIG